MAGSDPTLNPNPPVVPPTLYVQLTEDAEQIMMDKKMLAEDEQAEAAALHGIKNTANALEEIQMVLGKQQDVSADKLEVYADNQKLVTDLHNGLNQAQADYNTMVSQDPGLVPDPNHAGEFIPGPPTQAQVNAANDFVSQINQIQNFLADQAAEGTSAAIDPGTLADMQAQISGLQANFNTTVTYPTADGKDTATITSTWGDPNGMANAVNYWSENTKLGRNQSAFQSIQNNFSTLSSSATTLSSTVATQLQYEEENYKQYMGIYSSTSQAILQLNSTEIKAQTAS